ncbi:hypothetical protein HPHPP11B_1336 [Helicobacter pylori Hp P-11b]|uniref:Uncharacterized protein n=1 Tax=Helicobacter pylori Hp P-11b TaxID=992106 RepID=I9YEX6_HELPX|nr:hypothetical protein HPHPP11_0681 [Helicobacter pylori Hp P-11]EJC27240.1 hypothetical protein HPHPP11B_1336 [Helicobacter pylori Hp P-11b]
MRKNKGSRLEQMSHFLLKTKFCKGLSFSFYKDLSYPNFILFIA